MRVTLYTKAQCRLCEEAEVMLRRLQRNIHFDLEFVDVETDAAAYQRFGERIPVIAVDNEEVAAAPLDETRLQALLQA